MRTFRVMVRVIEESIHVSTQALQQFWREAAALHGATEGPDQGVMPTNPNPGHS